MFFVHKEVRRTNKTEIKDGLHFRNKKLSLSGDIIIYIAEDLLSKNFYIVSTLSYG